MALRTKAPADVLDYSITPLVPLPLLSGETIVSGIVMPAPSDLVIISVAPAAAGLLVWIAGGTAQTFYALSCAATTNQGRVFKWTSSIYVGTPGLDDPAQIAAPPLTS